MLTLKLALRNITHAGLRTWLNVFVLSFAFVLIIWLQGLYDGMMKQVVHDMKEIDVGGGQFWQRDYDPYDPLTLEDAHAPLSDELQALVDQKKAVPILIVPAAIYPAGRVQSVILKGIDPDQQIISLPTKVLGGAADETVIPAVIGSRMAKSNKLGIGDFVTVRWRDANGVFDAAEIQIVAVFSTNVQTVDNGQLWVPLAKLWDMMQLEGEASIVTLKQGLKEVPPGSPSWVYRDYDFLFAEINTLIETKKSGSSFMYVILMAMALLAVFDTQVLAIFRRRKEMGTLMALGMTRGRVIRLFTLEGSLHGLFAIILGAIYGIPFLAWQAKTGFAMPEVVEQGGFNMGTTLYPIYGAGLFISTGLLLFISVVIISFLPTRRIAKLKPTDALRGRAS